MREPPFKLYVGDVDRLQEAIKNYPQYAEKAINEVLHNEGSVIIQEEIKRLMPFSGRNPWRGKKTPAKNSKSLTTKKGNLFVDIKSKKSYQYLYFPDDGSNTRSHYGDQHFFQRGGERKQDKIIERCIGRLTDAF